MTPLAYRFAKRLTLPIKSRTPVYETGQALKAFDDIHCFECSELVELRKTMSPRHQVILADGVSFLPAPNTWIEWKFADGTRVACLLREQEEKTSLAAYVFSEHGHELLIARKIANLSLNSDYLELIKDDEYTDVKEQEEGMLHLISSALLYVAYINTPRIIGRRQHMPNRALERRLVQKLGVGKFPLHAWTEIKLEVTKPVEIDDGESHEAHLTGRRALHFCRAHIRVRNGKLEYVSHHWRGDAALGIKRSRYKLVA